MARKNKDEIRSSEHGLAGLGIILQKHVEGKLNTSQTGRLEGTIGYRVTGPAPDNELFVDRSYQFSGLKLVVNDCCIYKDQHAAETHAMSDAFNDLVQFLPQYEVLQNNYDPSRVLVSRKSNQKITRVSSARTPDGYSPRPAKSQTMDEYRKQEDERLFRE